jgi:uncharacterized membrane protein
MTTTVSPAQTYRPDTARPAGSVGAARPRTRIVSLDVIRGLVMVLMAIDHVRVYSGLPPGGPTPGIFFTRWVTNFCAPAFIFLAGTGAWLYGEKLGGKQGTSQLSRWLLTRGLWLVLLELTALRFAWTFNFDYARSGMAGVIWCIGWCMVGLAALVHLPRSAILGIGAVIVAAHNLVDAHTAALVPMLQASQWTWFWQILYFGGPIQAGGMTFGVLYSLVPWIGVMALGFAFGPIMRVEPARRARMCFAIGGAALLAFLVLRGFNLYGDPRPWQTAGRLPAALSFLATTKYPASLLFLLMTLGPTLIAIPLLEHAHGLLATTLTTFGRVPFFYYVLHIPLIHLAAVIVSAVRSGHVDPWLFANHPMLNPPAPAAYVWSLALLYLVWALVLIPLYFASRWYAAVKARSANPLLTYL